MNRYANTVWERAEPRKSGAQLTSDLEAEWARQQLARIKANERAYEAEQAEAEATSAGWALVTAGEIEDAVTREGWAVLADRVMEAGDAYPLRVSDRQFRELCGRLERRARREGWDPEPYFASPKVAAARLVDGYLGRKVRR